MAPAFDLPPHRQLVWYLETALDSLDEAGEMDGYLPHWAQRTLQTMVEDLESLLERLPREAPALGPLTDAELGADTEAPHSPQGGRTGDA